MSAIRKFWLWLNSEFVITNNPVGDYPNRDDHISI